MSLSPGNADLCGAAVSAAIQGLSPTDQRDPVKIWKAIMEVIYAHLITDIGATLGVNTVVTTGSASTQTGPASPVTIVIS